MKRLLLASALLWSGVASAADMPLKSLPATAYPTVKCGVYFGVNAEGKAGLVNGAPPGTTLIGGDVGGLVGYACPLGSFPWFAEFIADFQNLNASSNGFSLTGPAHLEERVGVQTPLIPFLSALGFPNLGTPMVPILPPGAAPVGNPANYIYMAVNEDDISASQGLGVAHAWLISPEIGTGLLTTIKMGTLTFVSDTYAGVELQTNSICLGAVMCPKLGVMAKVGESIKF